MDLNVLGLNREGNTHLVLAERKSELDGVEPVEHLLVDACVLEGVQEILGLYIV